MKKVAFYTLGCKLNFSETSTLGRQFEEKGFQKVDFFDKPNIYIINTCSVTENADKKCKQIVKNALKHSPDAFVAIVGCYAQLKPREIAEIEGVDAVLGASEKFKLLELLPSFEKQPKALVFHKSILEAKEYHSSFSINDRTRTFLKVQDGCDYTCTFCTIPLARGNSRSDTIENILNQTQQITDSGVKEIVLTGVNIGDYGLRNGKREETFLDLIQELDAKSNVERFRISSIEPNLLNDSIIKFVAKSNKFVPHFHIPLQSGNDKILKLMRRRYLTQLYSDTIQNIKTQMPNCCIGVDVIVGFPGETDEDFMETYQFIKKLDVSYLHVFSYSSRANTVASGMSEQVHPSSKAKRSEMLRQLSEDLRKKYYNQFLQTKQSVLFEDEIKDGFRFGFTPNYIRVAIEAKKAMCNETKEVLLASWHNDEAILAR